MTSSSDSDSDAGIEHLLHHSNDEKSPQKVNIWTKHLQEEELNTAIHSANVTVDQTFAHDEFKRYDPRYETGLTGYHNYKDTTHKNSQAQKDQDMEDGEISSDEPPAKKQATSARKVEKVTSFKTGYVPRNGSSFQANSLKDKDPKKRGDSKQNRTKNGNQNLYQNPKKLAQNKSKIKTTAATTPPLKRSHIDIAKAYPVGVPFYLKKEKDLTLEMPATDFTNELCYRLREPNKLLIASIVDLIGKEIALKQYLKTEEIEATGGLPINDKFQVTASGLKEKSNNQVKEKNKVDKFKNEERGASNSGDSNRSHSSDTANTSETKSPTPNDSIDNHSDFNSIKNGNLLTSSSKASSTASIDKIPELPVDKDGPTLTATLACGIDFHPKKTRRKTPGGIFIALVNSDSCLPDEIKKKIFELKKEQLKLMKQRQKLAKKNKNKLKNSKITTKIGSQHQITYSAKSKASKDNSKNDVKPDSDMEDGECSD